MENECEGCEFKGNFSQVRIYQLPTEDEEFISICNNCVFSDLPEILDDYITEQDTEHYRGNKLQYTLQDTMIDYVDALTNTQSYIDNAMNLSKKILDETYRTLIMKKQLVQYQKQSVEDKERIKEIEETLAENVKDEPETELEKKHNVVLTDE